MRRIEQVSLDELVKRQKVAVRTDVENDGTLKFKSNKLIEYIIPLFKKGVSLWERNR